MAELSAGRRAWDALRKGWTALPVSVRVLIVYVLARVVTTLFFAAADAASGPSSRFGVNPGIAGLATGWDGQWYWFAALNGYPAELPRTDDGLVAENQWAFMPVYAYLSQVVGFALGSWPAGAIAVSLTAGYLACLVLYRMLRLRGDDAMAMWTVVFFAAGPLAALFQVAYAESLFLLFLFLALWLVMRRRFGWLYVLVPTMGFTRPGVLAFSLFLALYGVARWFARKRDPLPARQIVHIVALGLLAAVVGFSWQVIAAVVTGDPTAYLATELAWRRNWLPGWNGAFVPFDGFVLGADFWFSTWGLPGWLGIVALVVIVAGVAALLLFEPHVKRLGVELRLWAASYLVYLFAVFFPQSSIFRLLVPLSPLWGAAAMPRSSWWRSGVLAVCLLAQWWWIHNMYALGNTYWQIP
ncbi:hypothetical protein [Microbacterium sp.]|uniref:hypothetical protein n=1 Tax=Microbacterium sp. TaxID=51671 RepID=UPI002D79ECCA|nr:hypothetical protein [Microbacterium sp.]HET6300872.1 hypothetical protein [Microbacterium sp.]